MTEKTNIQVYYDQLNVDENVGDMVNDLISEVVTEVLQIPGVKEAVAIHVLNSEIDLDEMNIHDVPFQYLWERLFSPELQGK